MPQRSFLSTPHCFSRSSGSCSRDHRDHGFEECGGKSLKHQKEVHGSQEWGGKGLGRRKMKHEKGFGCFMVPKRGVGRVWEGQE